MKLRRHPILAGSGLAILAILVLIVASSWLWLNPLTAWGLSKALGRPVSIDHVAIGDVLTGNPRLVFEGVTIGNPPDFPGDKPLGTIGKLSLRVAAWPLMTSVGRDIVVSDIDVERPKGDLRAAPDGRRNWAFASSGAGGGTSRTVRIGKLTIADGDFHIIDPKLKADLEVKLRTEAPRNGGESQLVASAQGTYAGQPFKGDFTGGSILSLRDPKKPYPVDLVAVDGTTRIALKGTVLDAAQLKGANLQLELEGQDLARLYPILGLPLAETPPFTLRGHLDYSATHIKLSNFTGTVGHSDLEGDFDVDRGYQRPLITAELSSQSVMLRELGGFLGTAPEAKPTSNEAPEHKAQQAQRAASPNLLPDEPFNFEKLHSADFRVHYKAQHVDSQWAPLDSINVNLVLENGKLVLQPLDFQIGHGSIASSLLLDAGQNPIHTEASIDFRQVDFQRLLQATNRFEGFGVVGGRAEFTGDGNSPAAMLANGNGDLKLFMNGGNVSALLVNLAGLDLGKSLLSALGLPDKTAIRCMVSDLPLQQGVLQTRALIFDTDEANIYGKGEIDLRNNTIDYKVSQQPKHFSILAFHAPINVTGPLKSPSIRPDPQQLGFKAALAAVTGLLATVQLGLGDNNDCRTLIQSAQQAAETPPRLAPKAPHPAAGSQPAPRPNQK